MTSVLYYIFVSLDIKFILTHSTTLCYTNPIFTTLINRYVNFVKYTCENRT